METPPIVIFDFLCLPATIWNEFDLPVPAKDAICHWGEVEGTGTNRETTETEMS
jgi:hypothetical protein